MDYDVELHAPEGKPVVLGDIKDGGLYVRVAGTMKAAQHFKAGGAKLDGEILNSRGDRNADCWGKRAEWVDFSGPDPSGKLVGIAMFDHPDNLRFPTHWHARTYGLLAANRFGTDHFDPRFAKPRTVSCRPHGTECPACNSRGGDYTIPGGERLTLRHRFYFHHGHADGAQVERHYREYAGPLTAQGEMAGEVTADSVLLQTRLTARAGLDRIGDIPGNDRGGLFRIRDRRRVQECEENRLGFRKRRGGFYRAKPDFGFGERNPLFLPGLKRGRPGIGSGRTDPAVPDSTWSPA